ncbi:2-polyprenyl-6-methoxyphenol hydroxylase [Streptomyces sp. yr375]|uniref:FAD-dependent monooxygenase n=1 Tax=Streptomyces sp. yr375 TaxID=1761906 RepID=UPI0008D25913|nr:FAD-dependent monooxygenase [Streptomyces sp. yr375]SES02811.1 2-polyprenyl-6-methoxyphenol hydroxylase [Streptomyces sp. yr375]
MTDTGVEYDVVVVGAGPVGLMLACELALGGVRTLVVERLAEVDETVKAGGINSPTAVALYRRGLLPALAAVQEAAMSRFLEFREAQRPRGEEGGAGAVPRFVGHFGGIMLDGRLLDGSDPDFADLGPVDGIRLVPQAALERLLGERARELGVEVRRQVEVTGFDTDTDTDIDGSDGSCGSYGAGVTVRLSSGPDVRAGWLVGCDGGRSTVRKLAGFDFPGTAPEITGYQAIADLTGTEGLGIGWQTTDVGTYAHGPMPGRILSVEFDGPPADRETPVTVEELQASVRRVTGVDVTVGNVRSITRFTDNCRQASSYRAGRVLLAGDAAHVHSPFGGQGLNLGIGDAMNLGWKLAAVVRGHAPEGLLDSYTRERHPIGAWVLDWTRAQVALMRPESHARALRKVVIGMAETVDGTTYLAKRVSGVWQRYDLPGDHPLVGRSAPDLELADGTRLADHLHTGRPLLLDLADDPKLRARAEGYGDRVDVRTVAASDRPQLTTLTTLTALTGLLVRPDGYVAWAADTESTESVPEDTLEAALERWFGAPAH